MATLQNETIGNQIAALMREGQEHYAAKRYDEAIAKFATITARDANNG